MKNGQAVSIGKILWKILRHPLATDLTYDEAAEYAIEIIGLIGSPVSYKDLFAEVEIEEHKGTIPNNIVYIDQVRDIETNIALREATDSFHSSDNKTSGAIEATYELKMGKIFTSFETGCVEIAYKALPVDEYGYPLIVDNPQLKMAIEYYVLSRYLEPLYDIGKISDKAFGRIEQKRHFYVAAAQNNLGMPSIDKMQSLVNSLNRLIINDNAHSNLFRFAGEKERIKKFR